MGSWGDKFPISLSPYPPCSAVKYTLYVDDNFHYMDEAERYQAGGFESLAEAETRAQQIVDKFLANAYKTGMTAAELYQQYTSFGEDPFIVGGPPASDFRAWNYARQRCEEICGKGRA